MIREFLSRVEVIALACVHLQVPVARSFDAQIVKAWCLLLRWKRNVILSAQLPFHRAEDRRQVFFAGCDVELSTGLVGQSTQDGVSWSKLVPGVNRNRIDLNFP